VRCPKGLPLIALADLAKDFAAAVAAADAKRPVAIHQRTGVSFQAGIGPHSELRTVRLVVEEMLAAQPVRHPAVTFGIPYPGKPCQKCDLMLGEEPDRLYVEAKLLRILGDNGKPNDNMLMHILSPYPQHRSAVTDCEKLRAATFPGRSAILIFGYEYEGWPLEPAIDAFERMARGKSHLGERHEALFKDLCHAVHRAGRGVCLAGFIAARKPARPCAIPGGTQGSTSPPAAALARPADFLHPGTLRNRLCYNG